MKKHTPGPWEDDPTWDEAFTANLSGRSTLGAAVFANGAPEGEKLVAECHGPRAKENARIMAAAPDMLAELQVTERLLLDILERFRLDSPTWDRVERKADEIRAAIRKARDGTP